MYPIASKVASLVISVLVPFITLLTRPPMRSGHCPAGSSATATYATHCAAELGLLFSVPKAPRICNTVGNVSNNVIIIIVLKTKPYEILIITNRKLWWSGLIKV